MYVRLARYILCNIMTDIPFNDAVLDGGAVGRGLLHGARGKRTRAQSQSVLAAVQQRGQRALNITQGDGHAMLHLTTIWTLFSYHKHQPYFLQVLRERFQRFY